MGVIGPAVMADPSDPRKEVEETTESLLVEGTSAGAAQGLEDSSYFVKALSYAPKLLSYPRVCSYAILQVENRQV